MKLNVIVPLRDRDDLLELFYFKMSKIFLHQGVDAKFFFIYQDNNKPFNKGILNNTGFQFAKKKNHSDRYLFNDVSVFPRFNDTLDFNIELKDKTLYHFMGNDFCINRFFLINEMTYEFINGYSNQYNGWGFEDTDLQNRCNLTRVNIDRSNFIERFRQHTPKFIDIIFEDVVEKYKAAENTPSDLKYKEIFESGKSIEEVAAVLYNDGLSDLNNYNVTGDYELSSPNAYKLKVDFEN